MAAAALVAELSASDPLLEWPAASASWALEDIRCYHDSCGMWSPEQALARGAEPVPEPVPELAPWAWALPTGYAEGPPHRLLHGDARPPRNPAAKLRLFCFLWTGGMATYFERLLCPLVAAAGPLELVAVNLPGRERAGGLPLAKDWAGLVTVLADALTVLLPGSGGGGHSWVTAMPYAFYGHSLGGWVEYEVALELRRRGSCPLPLHMLVSSALPGTANALTSSPLSHRSTKSVRGCSSLAAAPNGNVTGQLEVRAQAERKRAGPRPGQASHRRYCHLSICCPLLPSLFLQNP